MMAFIMSLITPVIESLRDHVLDRVLQTIRVGDNLGELNSQVENLRLKWQDVENAIKLEEPVGKVATKEAQGWLENAIKLEKEASVISNKYKDRNCMILSSYSLNCYLSHSISVSTLELKARVETELQRIHTIQLTTFLPPPPVQLLPTAILGQETGYEIQSKLNMALDFLRSSDGEVLGIWGMGGVGKTTVLRHINNALANDLSLRFDRVIFVTASRDCNIEKIQADIAKELKLPNDSASIFNFLNNKSFVILLDDLWERLDLERVGIPPLGVLNGVLRCKMILTTRIHQVCLDMDARHCTVRVDCLSQDNARRLFREKFGEEVFINSHASIQDLADKISDECDGLPMALITVARAMAGKTSFNLWNKALKDLRASKISMILGKEDPLPLLKLSYDYLENPSLQECLLLCALWPEDVAIPVDVIMRCWMGHNLLGEFNNIEEAFDNALEIINCLHKASLLEYSMDPFTTGSVRLHDLIRDMVLWIARDCGANEKKWTVVSGMELDEAPRDKKLWMEAYKISLMSNKVRKLPCNVSAPNLITLMLQHNSLHCDSLQIIQNFHQLKYLDLSQNHLNSFPMEICRLCKLEYLNLSGNNIHSLPEELKDIKRLKYFLLEDNKISQVPSELFSSMDSLEVLDLSTRRHDASQSIIINNLDGLKGRLKALGINACSQLDLDNLSELSVPITNLMSYIKVGERGTSSDLLPHSNHYCDPTWSNMRHFTVKGSTHEEIQELEELVIDESYDSFPKILVLENLHCLKTILWKGVKNKDAASLNRLTHVNVYWCSELKHLNWIVNLPFLEFLSIRGSNIMEHMIWEEESETESDAPSPYNFPTLSTLRLSHLPQLKSICNRAINLPSLSCLHVRKCESLKKLPFDTPASCTNLKRIWVEKEWWENTLELDDDISTYLQPRTAYYRRNP